MQISRIIEKEMAGLEGGIYSLFFDAAAKVRLIVLINSTIFFSSLRLRREILKNILEFSQISK